MNTAITKVSVFLRTVGNSKNTISIPKNGAAFDASNFSKLDQGNPNAIFDNSISGYYGSGYMKIEPKEGSSVYLFPSFTYPIKVEEYGKYKLFIRIKSDENSSFSFSIIINDISVSDHEVVVTDSWSWIYVDLVIPDTRDFDLTFVPKTENSYIDSFYITKEEIPVSFSYVSSYITLHERIFKIESESVGESLPTYQYKTTIEEIVDDNWYNFETTPLLGHSSIVFDSTYAIALFSSGDSEERYLIWDYGDEKNADSTSSFCGLTFNKDNNTWDLDCSKNYSIRAYSFRDSLDESACKIVVPASALEIKKIQRFDTDNLLPIFVQTKVVDEGNNINKVSLSLPDRIVSFIEDQSGSMSWNDKDGLRHTMTQRVVDRLESTYPGEVKYNLIGFGSTPIKINFYAVVESDQVNTSNAANVASSYFFDQESGYAGVRVIRKKDSYPTSPLDGEIVTEGFVERAYDEGLDEGENYFYAAYTFNSNGIFSDGRFINSFPRLKIVPYGVGGFTYRVITGSGSRRDENLIGAWHLNESYGFDAYDFSDNPISLSSSEDLIWLNSTDVPSGVSGIRFDGSSTRLSGLDSGSKLIQDKYTFMAWVYPFNFASKRTIISREDSSNNKISFNLGINSNGTLFFNMDNILTASSSGSLVENEWNHIAITVNSSDVKFYINGSIEGVGSISRLGNYSSESMNFYIGGEDSSFFGKITEVSIHNTIKSDGYISMMSIMPQSSSEKINDNGDRIIVLKYTVPDDFNYDGGQVSIVRKEEKGTAIFDYESNNLVFKGFGEKPSSEIDGEMVYNQTASVGFHSVVLPYDYIHNRTYNFRIYSKNSIGNYSLSSDSPILSIEIPSFETKATRDEVIPIPSISKIENVTIRAGNHKTYIQWSPSTDPETKQILVYWSSSGYPIINNETGVDSTALLVFSGDPSSSELVDRNLENETVNYYAIVAADRYGNMSIPVYVSEIPLDTADESGIPLLEVKQFRYEIVDENTLSLAWDAPVKFQNDIQSWFDQRVVLYAEITDEFGSPITDASNISFVANASIKSTGLAEDVFAESINREVVVPKVENCYVLSSTVISNGLIKGFFRMTTDLDILSSINSLSADIVVSYKIPDRNNPSVNVFEFTSLPVHIEMLNPFSMELVNIGDNSFNFGTIATLSGVKRKSKRRNPLSSTDPVSLQNTRGDLVKFLCKQTVPLDDQSFISSGGLLFDPDKFKEFNGCWIRRSKPFVARIVVTYRGQAIPAGNSCNAAVFEALDPQCDPDEEQPENPCSQLGSTPAAPVPFVPGFSNRRSRTVQPPSTSILFKTGLQRLEDGSTKQISYADIPLTVPRSPHAVMLFGKTSYNGYYSRKKMYIVFDNILRIETTVESPETNCIDVAEQKSIVYMIDPNSPNVDSPIKIAIPDQQIVRWNLRKGRNSKDRPFYSTDNVSSGPGVFSYTRSGSAKKVFFGPACGVTWEVYVPCPGNIIYLPEMYAIKASVVYDGLSAFEERPSILYPPNFTGIGFGSRFLMSMTQYVNVLYADGYDLARVTIYHDPNITGGIEAECFRDCATNSNRPIFVLDNGQIVDIESGSDFEILYGDDLVTNYDETLGEYVVTQANQTVGFAQVPLASTGSSTSFYLRINKFIGKPKSEPPVDNNSSPSPNPCDCIQTPPGLSNKKDLFVVNGRTTINFNGETRYLRGGGDIKTGVPPTTIDLREPLDILIVDIRREGKSVNKVLCDGHSVHEFLVEVTFKHKPVPNGTPIFLTIGGKNPEKIILLSDTIYTEKVNDSILNPTGDVRSFASFFIESINSESSFESQIQAETNYDKRGDVERSMTTCITIKYDSSQPKEEPVKSLEGEISNIYSSSLDIYDTIDNNWTTKSSMNYPRGCLTLNWTFSAYSEMLYAIGGINGKSILSYNEMYDIDADSWTSKKSMITPRFYHMSAQDGNYIYIFGGITATGSNLSITNSVERYNIETDEWELLEEMPSFGQDTYGVALGSCVVSLGKAYIIGGIRRIGQSGSIDAMNDRVLVFDFDSLSWEWSDAFVDNNLVLYERISPFAFVSFDSSSIRVLGGAVSGVLNTITGEIPLEFITDSFKLDLSNLSISLDDFVYSHLPSPRYRGSSVSIYDKHYFLGGTNSKSSVLNIFDIVSEGSPTYSYESLNRMPVAKTSFGSSSDNWKNIYVAGGLTSGRPAGFLQIKAKVNPSSIRLDGKQSSTVSIELLNDIGEHPSKTVRAIVQGILMFPGSSIDTTLTGGDQSQQQSSNSALRDALVYPVIFSSNDFNINEGLGSTIMFPRADDILKKISEIQKSLGIEDTTLSGNQDNTLKIIEGEIRNPYKIKVRITIIDDFYYGQTVVDIKDNEDVKNSTSTPTSGATGSPTSTSGNTGNPVVGVVFDGCRSINASQFIESSSNTGNQNTGRDNENNQPIDQTLKDGDNPVFDLNPPQTPQFDSPEVSYYSDIEWIPQVINYVNNGEYSDITNYIGKLRNSVPFGASPLYDALVKNASILLDESLDKYVKVIYVNTDNEENLSVYSLNTVIEDIQSIDGFGRVPVVINNFSIVFPVTLSALVSRTDTDSLDSISNETGGESQTILDEKFVDEVLNNSIGRVEGSIGWGLYECIVDLNSNSIINSISLDYELFSNTDGNWSFATSEDGFNYSEYSDNFNPNTEVEFTGVNARYLKFKIALLSGLSSSIVEEYETIPTPGSPSLTSINVKYSIPTESYIYFNPEILDYSPQQIAVSISATRPELSQIQIGATTSNSHNWIDYQSGAQPSVNRYGKIVIPIRYNQDNKDLNEPLENINGFMWRTKYGRWDSTSTVVIRDENNNIIDTSIYKTYPQEGIVVFNSNQSGPFSVSIENAGKLKIGVKIINMDSVNPLIIDGLGYMYNTNVFLPPPLSQRPPAVSELRITPSNVTVYQKIGLSYKYFDINQLEENKSESEIKWYINGVEIEYLRNLRTWNDIENTNDPVWIYSFSFTQSDIPSGTSTEQFARQRQESLLKVNDSIYVTMKASDGVLYSSLVRSPSLVVIEAPPFVSSVVIKGKKNDGSVQNSVTSATRAFAEFAYFQDSSDSTKSQIIWYVNGLEFKRGDLNATVGGISNNEILVGEIKNNILGISLGNILEVTILPASQNIIGNPVSSPSISVENDPPSVRSVTISPNPKVLSSSSLQLSYTYVDTESQKQGGTQNDQSSVRWLKSSKGSSSFIEVPSLQNARNVSAVNTSSGDKWYAEIIPFDGISVGNVVKSNVVEIL